MKAQKHAHFDVHVLVPPFTPHYITIIKGLYISKGCTVILAGVVIARGLLPIPQVWLSRQEPASLDHSLKYYSRTNALGKNYVESKKVRGIIIKLLFLKVMHVSRGLWPALPPIQTSYQ